MFSYYLLLLFLCVPSNWTGWLILRTTCFGLERVFMEKLRVDANPNLLLFGDETGKCYCANCNTWQSNFSPSPLGVVRVGISNHPQVGPLKSKMGDRKSHMAAVQGSVRVWNPFLFYVCFSCTGLVFFSFFLFSIDRHLWYTPKLIGIYWTIWWVIVYLWMW